MVGKVDVVANVEGGGFSGQAGAIRWGIAMGLRSFVDADTIDKMRMGKILRHLFFSDDVGLNNCFCLQLVYCNVTTAEGNVRSLGKQEPVESTHGKSVNIFLITIKVIEHICFNIK